jgi:hypothetical protein
MLCDQCIETPATFFLNQIIDGELTQRKLCESCALPILRQLPPARWTSYTPTEDSLQELLKRPADCPADVTLTDPVTIRDLATALLVEVFHVIGVLMQHDIYKSPKDALDFATASLVCAHYGVTPHKVARN